MYGSELLHTKAMFGVITMVRVAGLLAGQSRSIPDQSHSVTRNDPHKVARWCLLSLQWGIKANEVGGRLALWWHLIGGRVRGRVGGNCKIGAGRQKLVLVTVSFLSTNLLPYLRGASAPVKQM